jgi:hypothetical protein
LGPPATIAIFICDLGTILAAGAALLLEVLLLEVLLMDVLPLDELPLLQAAAPRMLIATSGARHLQLRRLPAGLLR